MANVGDGRSALRIVEETDVDLMALDTEMPGMSGLETLLSLRSRGFNLPVVMLSSPTRRGASSTLDALLGGASDYVSKPRGAPLQRATSTVRRKMLERIEALCGPVGERPRHTTITGEEIRPESGGTTSLCVVASIGDVPALYALLASLPATTPPIVVATRLDSLLLGCLAERLDKDSRLSLLLGDGTLQLSPGTAVLLPETTGALFSKHGQSQEVELTLTPVATKEAGLEGQIVQCFNQELGEGGTTILLRGALSLGLPGTGTRGIVLTESDVSEEGSVWAPDEPLRAASIRPLTDALASLCNRTSLTTRG